MCAWVAALRETPIATELVTQPSLIVIPHQYFGKERYSQQSPLARLWKFAKVFGLLLG
jgi:hypothetical protein